MRQHTVKNDLQYSIKRMTFLGTALDVWGFGCVFAEMTLREPLFRGECEIDQLLLIFR